MVFETFDLTEVMDKVLNYDQEGAVSFGSSVQFIVEKNNSKLLVLDVFVIQWL